MYLGEIARQSWITAALVCSTAGAPPLSSLPPSASSSSYSHLLSDSSAIFSASISASSIFCSRSRRSSWPRMALTLMRCISVSASAAFWASSLASSSAIWAFSASRSAVCSERSWPTRRRRRSEGNRSYWAKKRVENIRKVICGV